MKYGKAHSVHKMTGENCNHKVSTLYTLCCQFSSMGGSIGGGGSDPLKKSQVVVGFLRNAALDGVRTAL